MAVIEYRVGGTGVLRAACIVDSDGTETVFPSEDFTDGQSVAIAEFTKAAGYTGPYTAQIKVRGKNASARPICAIYKDGTRVALASSTGEQLGVCTFAVE